MAERFKNKNPGTRLHNVDHYFRLAGCAGKPVEAAKKGKMSDFNF
jgi:hypothetical protein